eukprot:5212125-Ditylum_brightwellii.AAC.1
MYDLLIHGRQYCMAVHVHTGSWASRLNLWFHLTGGTTSSSALVTNIVDGVVEVTVNTVCATQCAGDMVNDINNALVVAFGYADVNSFADNLANYVMHCLPPGAMSGIMYANVNSWLSVYDDNWCQYTSVQLHEIGHNINLASSGEFLNTPDDEYQDIT